MDGKYFPKTKFDAIELVGPLTFGRFAFLAGLGAVVIVLEQAFRYPLQLPGHHGLESMALLTLGRLSCTSKWSATIVGTSAATTATVAGVDHGALMPLLYLVPALLLDVGFGFSGRARQWVLYLPFVAALAFASKPLMRWIAHLGFGFEFGSLRYGAGFPIVTHMLFGFVGALTAVILFRATVRQPAEPDERT